MTSFRCTLLGATTVPYRQIFTILFLMLSLLSCSHESTPGPSKSVTRVMKGIGYKPTPTSDLILSEAHQRELLHIARQICDGALHLFGAGHKFSQVLPLCAHQHKVGAFLCHCTGPCARISFDFRFIFDFKFIVRNISIF